MRIGPTLLSRFIPTVIEQSGFVVARMALHQDELLCDVVECGRFVKGDGILGVERFTHVKTVEPHLRRVDLFVPEAAFRSARVRFQLFDAGARRLFCIFPGL